MDLKAYLAERREMVEEALAAGLPPAEGLSERLIAAMRYSLFSGGKRLRPILCLAGAEAVGARPEVALPVAVALEMIHTYSLIHDDLPVMDNDDLRRGQATSHKVYGEALAVLAGDGLLTEGLGLLARAGREGLLDPALALRALELITQAAGYEGMVAGQAVDIEFEGRDVDEATVQFIHTRKTGALISAAVTSGALVGGGEQRQIKDLERYGRRLGLAFQITDDILDIEGDAAELGKRAGADTSRGKATYPAVVGLPRARELAADLVAGARSALANFGPEADPLREIAGYLLTRRK